MKTDYLEPWPVGEPPEPAFGGDEERLSVLSSYDLDGLEDDSELAEITRFAAKLCDTPTARVSLVDDVRQRFIARTGLTDRETPRNQSICSHAMLQAEPLVVPDLTSDDRFKNYPPVVGEPHIRFYAGAPLISHEGAPLGSLCVIDIEPRPDGLTEIQQEGLQVLAASVMRRLRHRRENLEQKAELEQSEQRLRTLIDSLPDIAYSIRDDGSFEYVNAQFTEVVGVEAPRNAEDWRLIVHPDDHEPLFSDWYETFEKGDPFEAQFRLKRRDDSWRWVLTRVLPVDNVGEGPRWFGTITDIEDTRREAEARKLLASELSHRIKNIFAVIGGLVRLKSREYLDVQPFAEDLAETLDTLGRAHRYATQESVAEKGDTLHGILAKILAPYGDSSGKSLHLTGDDVPISNRATTPLALVFHELATNSAKYGAFSVAEGTVSVSTKRMEDRIAVRWQETGGPPASDDGATGFGSRLVKATVNGQLRGELNRSFEPEGLVAVLTVPVDAL